MMPERVEWSDNAPLVGMCCRPALGLSSIAALSSMSADLAVDKLEAEPGIGDLLAEAGNEFGEEVAVFAGSGLGVEVQLGDLSSEQRRSARGVSERVRRCGCAVRGQPLRRRGTVGRSLQRGACAARHRAWRY